MEDAEHPVAREARSAPGVVSPMTKVNVALPFSNLQIREASDDPLAQVVVALAELVGEGSTSPNAAAVIARARAIGERLR